MQDKKALKLIDQIEKDFSENGLEPEKIYDQLMELREFSKKEKDPYVTKVLRLTAEYIEENEDFNISFFEDEEEAEISSFEFFLELIRNSHNKFNREEIESLLEYYTSLEEEDKD